MPGSRFDDQEYADLAAALEAVRRASWARKLAQHERKQLESVMALLSGLTSKQPATAEAEPDPDWESSDLLLVNEAAELIGCSEGTVYRRLLGYRLPPSQRPLGGEWAAFVFKIGNDWRIEKGGLLQHVATFPIHSRQSGDALDPMPKPARPQPGSRDRFKALLEEERQRVTSPST